MDKFPVPIHDLLNARIHPVGFLLCLLARNVLLKTVLHDLDIGFQSGLCQAIEFDPFIHDVCQFAEPFFHGFHLRPFPAFCRLLLRLGLIHLSLQLCGFQLQGAALFSGIYIRTVPHQLMQLFLGVLNGLVVDMPQHTEPLFQNTAIFFCCQEEEPYGMHKITSFSASVRIVPPLLR